MAEIRTFYRKENGLSIPVYLTSHTDAIKAANGEILTDILNNKLSTIELLPQDLSELEDGIFMYLGEETEIEDFSFIPGYVYAVESGNIVQLGYINDEEISNLKTWSSSKISSEIGTVDGKVETIESLIPEQASQSNILADRNFVNSSVQTATANFRGNWENWTSVPTDASLYPADYAGSTVPTVNDYLVIRDASDVAVTKNVFNPSRFEDYNISLEDGTETPTTPAPYQQVSSAYYIKVAGGSTLTYSFNTLGVTILRVHAYGAYKNWLGCIINVTGNQGEGDTVLGNEVAFIKITKLYYTDSVNVTADTWEEGTWRYKYSGTWEEVGKAGWFPEYQVNETPLTADQLAAINSGITAEENLGYKNHINNQTAHVSQEDRETWNGKQDALTAGADIIIQNNEISVDDVFARETELEETNESVNIIELTVAKALTHLHDLIQAVKAVFSYDETTLSATIKAAGMIKNESSAFSWINGIGLWIINLGQDWGIFGNYRYGQDSDGNGTWNGIYQRDGNGNNLEVLHSDDGITQLKFKGEENFAASEGSTNIKKVSNTGTGETAFVALSNYEVHIGSGPSPDSLKNGLEIRQYYRSTGADGLGLKFGGQYALDVNKIGSLHLSAVYNNASYPAIRSGRDTADKGFYTELLQGNRAFTQVGTWTNGGSNPNPPTPYVPQSGEGDYRLEYDALGNLIYKVESGHQSFYRRGDNNPAIQIYPSGTSSQYDVSFSGRVGLNGAWGASLDTTVLEHKFSRVSVDGDTEPIYASGYHAYYTAQGFGYALSGYVKFYLRGSLYRVDILIDIISDNNRDSEVKVIFNKVPSFLTGASGSLGQIDYTVGSGLKTYTAILDPNTVSLMLFKGRTYSDTESDTLSGNIVVTITRAY